MDDYKESTVAAVTVTKKLYNTNRRLLEFILDRVEMDEQERQEFIELLEYCKEDQLRVARIIERYLE